MTATVDLGWLDEIAPDLRTGRWVYEGTMIVDAETGEWPSEALLRRRMPPSSYARRFRALTEQLGWTEQQHHAFTCAEAHATWTFGSCCNYPERHLGLQEPVRRWLEGTCGLTTVFEGLPEDHDDG